MKSYTLLLFFVLFLLSFGQPAFAQSSKPDAPLRTFKAGQLDVHLGIGVLPTYLADRKRSSQAFPAIYAALDYRISKTFTLGVYYGQSESQTNEYLFSDGVRGNWLNSTRTYGVRSAFHIGDRIKNTDIYGGFTVGRTVVNVDCSDETMGRMKRYMGIEDIEARTVMSAFLGGRYTFAPRLSAFAEIGAGGVALARAGLAYQLF